MVPTSNTRITCSFLIALCPSAMKRAKTFSSSAKAGMSTFDRDRVLELQIHRSKHDGEPSFAEHFFDSVLVVDHFARDGQAQGRTGGGGGKHRRRIRFRAGGHHRAKQGCEIRTETKTRKAPTISWESGTFRP